MASIFEPPARIAEMAVNMEPIKITVEMRAEDTGELLQHISWTLDVKSKILGIPIFFPTSDIKSVRL